MFTAFHTRLVLLRHSFLCNSFPSVILFLHTTAVFIFCFLHSHPRPPFTRTETYTWIDTYKLKIKHIVTINTHKAMNSNLLRRERESDWVLRSLFDKDLLDLLWLQTYNNHNEIQYLHNVVWRPGDPGGAWEEPTNLPTGEGHPGCGVSTTTVVVCQAHCRPVGKSARLYTLTPPYPPDENSILKVLHGASKHLIGKLISVWCSWHREITAAL